LYIFSWNLRSVSTNQTKAAVNIRSSNMGQCRNPLEVNEPEPERGIPAFVPPPEGLAKWGNAGRSDSLPKSTSESEDDDDSTERRVPPVIAPIGRAPPIPWGPQGPYPAEPFPDHQAPSVPFPVPKIPTGLPGSPLPAQFTVSPTVLGTPQYYGPNPYGILSVAPIYPLGQSPGVPVQGYGSSHLTPAYQGQPQYYPYHPQIGHPTQQMPVAQGPQQGQYPEPRTWLPPVEFRNDPLPLPETPPVPYHPVPFPPAPANYWHTQ